MHGKRHWPVSNVFFFSHLAALGAEKNGVPFLKRDPVCLIFSLFYTRQSPVTFPWGRGAKEDSLFLFARFLHPVLAHANSSVSVMAVELTKGEQTSHGPEAAWVR